GLRVDGLLRSRDRPDGLHLLVACHRQSAAGDPVADPEVDERRTRGVVGGVWPPQVLPRGAPPARHRPPVPGLLRAGNECAAGVLPGADHPRAWLAVFVAPPGRDPPRRPRIPEGGGDADPAGSGGGVVTAFGAG